MSDHPHFKRLRDKTLSEEGGRDWKHKFLAPNGAGMTLDEAVAFLDAWAEWLFEHVPDFALVHQGVIGMDDDDAAFAYKLRWC